MASPPTNLHFVLFPWPAQGHLIPMVDIARMLAERDVMVTVITTPVNTNRIKTVIDRAIEANLKIQVLDIQLPFAKAGLPEGCESFDMIPSVSYVANMFLAMKLLEEPAEEMLRVLYPPPSCIISDGGFHWTSDVAKRLIVPRIIFYGPGCFASLCINIVNNTNILGDFKSDLEYFALPGLPDCIEVTKPQASSWGKGNTKETRETFERTQEAEKAAFGIVVNSFDALEPKYVEEFAKATGKKVWCIGPVSLCNKSLEDIAERGNKAANGEHDCLKWLDSREPRSVVYVCFGSFSSTLTHQAIELALGLESSNIPFVWFVSRTSDEFEKWTSEGQYEERIKGRGLMVRGWAPQILVLSHQAIGGFITHCGWNSTLEAICAGIPMVTWPHFADQFLNERFIVNVLKIGLKIGVEVPITYRGKEKFEVMVKREAIKLAVEGLMNDEDEDEAQTRRNRAKEVAQMAKKAMEDEGSSHLNLTMMIAAITEELALKNKSIKDIV
ncbi:putative UDP-glucuronosyl/UDP-glucosyltransferase, UDP-glycosyltransferase family [Helianthus annuus]|uniref:UDP-glycosyltransferase 73E1 n=1 Tax=Helianthus annuus TaxID=4232 RepID=UPI000B8F160C|nr:UDP-glycosyltransferase 73E1 [Helianthus annuus]KAJ0628363.1 putative UDP-glucuronosyl/UDP-glucosyltransferase, UDP-glycosyltransferase family [Helianthus annuus]KAJ0949716.1 putative UDP-glucuronosyl/UDP-glucosyltransferase, UDP-glycosyltransferase family [Helianthus annuus]